MLTMNSSFRYWLKQQRRSLDLTQEELAERIGCSSDLIRKIEAGTRRPSRYIAEQLALSLEIAPESREIFVRFARLMPCDSAATEDAPALPQGADAADTTTRPQRYVHNLPAPPTLFIGREQEVATVSALLRRTDVRLVTLNGPGGVGKTRLAIQAAAEALEEFADGIYFVDLAPISDPNLVVAAIAQTLGVRETGGQPLLESLQTYLRGRRLLLLLDNFEQVLAAAPHLADLLSVAPQLKLLVTSRAILHLRGEQEFAVPPLNLPDLQQLPPLEALSQYAAVQLFIARALDVKPDFAITNANAPAVVEICARLDGLPLAIELAAAWIKLFPPQALLARLDRRLNVLTSRMRDLPARQQTLRHTLDWSYELLEAGMQVLFARLGVFVGGCTIAGAEAVCELSIENEELSNDSPSRRFLNAQFSMLNVIAALVDHSLLRQTVGADGEPRFTMLETIREYALERLEQRGEADVLRRQHAHFFLALAEEADAKITGAEQSFWLGRLEQEHDNLRAALAWCQTPAGDVELGLRFGVALWWFWEIRGYFHEGRRWLEGMLAQAPARTLLRASALNGAGALVYDQGDYAAARMFHEESLALRRELGDQRGIAGSLNNLGNVAKDQGEHATARALYEESLAVIRELGDRWGIAIILNNLGNVAKDQGEHATARAFHEESLAIQREVGDQRSIATSLHALGEVALAQGDDEPAAALFEESLSGFRELGDKPGVASALHNLGNVASNQGSYAMARTLYAESLAIREELGDQRGIAVCLAGLAGVAEAHDQLERAAQLLGAVAALLEHIGGRLDAIERGFYDCHRLTVQAALDADQFMSAWAAGQSMPLKRAIAYALEPTDGDGPCINSW
jgi:predicted ATPase/DNA-binding XRE family transcriptional regulator